MKRIRYRPSEGLAFGLTVPGLQNYVGGFGACGINHNTYPLPEAQADRFLLKIITTYPSYEDELKIVDKYSFHSEPPSLPILINKKTLFALQTLVRQVPIATDLKHRIVKIVTETRKREGMMEYGASPRASIGLVLACKARALMEGRNYVSSKDIETMAYPVLRHRIILNFEAVRKGIKPEDAIRDVLAKVK
ncbi:MoxR family ATPase [Candidatus Woesearchaeota archaeon]|nr:MoxR family ATPase [Candidatus Woesearchaeota archaeon]